MALQEKIDKLPLSIEYEGKVYNLRNVKRERSRMI